MKIKPDENEYNDYVEKVTPTHNCVKNCLWAFVVGGIICTIGECIIQYLTKAQGMKLTDASSYTSLILIFLSVLLTGFNVYPTLAKFGGAGALVPITGFANSVAATAIEFQKEGQVFGIGVKIFTIAGPVILYGIVVSWGLGVIYWLCTNMGWL